ncbi:MAG: PqqD family protein [Candidatus Binataceae bacterium]
MNDRFVRRSSKTAARALGDEMVVLSVIDSTLFSLNEAARLLWEAADGRRPLREIVAEVIVPQFEVDAETAYRDALEWAEQLAGHGVLELADQPLAQADA